MPHYFDRKGRKDWDNFHMLGTHTLSGIAWEDDDQIDDAHVDKRYDENPQIELTISKPECPLGQLIQSLDPWWSVIGLTFDLFGFTILALDLGRDYWRTARSDFYKRAARSARFLIPTEIVVDAEEFLASGKRHTDAYKFRNVRDHYENFFVRWAWFRMRLADFRKHGRWFKPEPGFDEMASIFDSLAEEAIEARYRRTPLYVGIFLILLGFALQIVGSWPGE